MPIFKNIFACSSQDTEEKDDIKRELNLIKNRMELLERDVNMNLNRFNDRIENKLSILESKIDNLVLLLTTNR